MDPAPDKIGPGFVQRASSHAPGSRPHDGRQEQTGPYPEGMKGIVFAFLLRRTVFRAGWAMMASNMNNDGPAENLLHVVNGPSYSPENICRTNSK
jgi:hypothetical protein